MMAHQNKPYPLRMPDEMRDYLQLEADKNNRSLHAEIMVRLQSSIPDSVAIPKESFSRPSGSRKFVHQQKLQITDRRINSDPSDGQLKGLLARMMELIDLAEKEQDEAREIVEENEAYERWSELESKEYEEKEKRDALKKSS